MNDGGSLCALLIRRQMVGILQVSQFTSSVGWDRSRLRLQAVTAIFGRIVNKSRLVQFGADALVYHTLKGIGMTFRIASC